MQTDTPRVIRPRRKSPLVRLAQSWQLYVLLLPAVAYLIIFHYIPLYGVQIAFRDYRPRNGFLGSTWVGLKHFKYFLHSPQFPQLMRNTVLLSLYSLIFTFPLPILLALLLNECGSVGYKKFVQNVTYAPHFISTVVLCGMVIAFTAPDTGIINSLVVLLGGKSVDYMTQESSWRAIYVISDIWKNTGWSSIIYLAALAGIDPEEVITCRPADNIAPELETYKEQFKDIAKSEEDVLSLALFPQVAPKFLAWRDGPHEAPAQPAEAPKAPPADPNAVRELFVEYKF